MWVPSAAITYFDRLVKVSEDNALAAQKTNATLIEELAKARAENAVLRSEGQATKVNMDWLRIRGNKLELENAALLQKAYNISLPVPELVRTPNAEFDNTQNFSFDDIGDEAARRLGLPVYS